MTLPVLLSITLACNPTTGLTSVEDPENPPPPPKNLTASPSSEGLVEGAFSYSSTEHDGFRVYRNAGNGERVHLELEPEETSFVDSKDVAPGEAYVYKVRAFNEAGESPPSNVVEVAVEEGESSSPDSTSSPKPTPDQDALLTGMTPSDMTVPEGWSVAATEGFESGSTSGALAGGSSVTTNRPHTGEYSVEGFIGGDGYAMGVWLGSLSGTEYYLSFYEYIESQAAFNDETFFAFFEKRTGSGFQQVIFNMFWDKGGNYNSPKGQWLVTQEASDPDGKIGALWSKSTERTRKVGKWVQYEIRYKPNTPGSSDGEFDVWEDGTLIISGRNLNLNGSVDMSSGVNVSVQYLYTKHNWLKKDSSGNCVGGDFIGDGVAYNGSDCHESLNVSARCKDFNSGCYVPPTPPAHDVWRDDVIVLER